MAEPTGAAPAMKQDDSGKNLNDQSFSLATALSELEGLAEHVFGDKYVASSWLRQANLATDNVPPLDLIGTRTGFERVKNLLLRIEYGVLA